LEPCSCEKQGFFCFGKYIRPSKTIIGGLNFKNSY
jgi:hypothetical protein